MSHISIAPSQTSALVIVKCVCVLNLTFGFHHSRELAFVSTFDEIPKCPGKRCHTFRRESGGIEQKETSGGVSKKNISDDLVVVRDFDRTSSGCFGESAPPALVRGRVGCALRMMKRGCVVVHGGETSLW